MASLLSQGYDVDQFRNTGHQLIDLLADQLYDMREQVRPTTSYSTPNVQLEKWRNYKVQDPITFFTDLIGDSIALHHPKYIGHQVSAPLPLTALAGLVSDLLNNGMGIYEMGAAATAMEKVVIESFCNKIGYDSTGDGFLTSGGTLANLTALLAARSAFERKNGNAKPYIIVSDQAHYCIERALHTMGIEQDQIIKIAVQNDFTISVKALQAQIKMLRAESKSIMAVVASACTTATGSYDPLIEIGKICEANDVWLHVDGAHGGAVAWSVKYKHLLKGIEKANSIVIDAHKMMMIPALATAVLFKNQEDSYQIFQQDAHYLWRNENPEWYNLAKRTYETTKFMASVKIYLMLKYYGDEIVDEYVTRQYNLTRDFAKYMEVKEDIELCHIPQSNILCFRYINPGLDENEVDKINAEIRKEITQKGDFYIVQATVNSKTYLRVTIMNPLTTMSELRELDELVTETAEKILKRS